MTCKQKRLTAGALIMSLTVLAGDAHSAPLQGMASHTSALGIEAINVQYRLCVTEGGARRCRTVEIYGPTQGGYPAQVPSVFGYQTMPSRAYGYQAPTSVEGAYPLVGYGYAPQDYYVDNYTEAFPNPDMYPTGSPAWWKQMDKLGRGGTLD